MAKKKDKEIKALTSSLESARRAGNIASQADLRLSLANAHRRLGDKEEALEELQHVLDLAKRAKWSAVKTDECLALRGIAEIYAEDGNERCREYLDRFEARVRDDPTEHQLMLTVASYCLIKLFSVDDRKDHLLEPARVYAEESLRLLEYERMGKMREGDSVSIRRTNCHRMLAEIAAYQNNQSAGEMHSKAAFESAKGKKDSQFEIMRARIDFPWWDDGHKVRAARELCDFAEANATMKNKRAEAHIFLAQAFFEHREVERGENALLEICEVLSGKRWSVPDDDYEKYVGLLVFAYRASERLSRLRKCMEQCDRAGQQRHHDKLGDLYDGAGFKKAALAHYQAALDLTSTRKETRRALVSCAETTADLKMYARAAGYFERVMREERETGIDTSETEASLFDMRLLAGHFASDSDMCLAIERLEKDGNKFMSSVYSATAKHYERRGNKEEAERYWKLEAHFSKMYEGEKASDDDEGQSEENADADSLDEMDDTEIVEIMREKARKRAKKVALAKSGRKENQYGESKLIERAREGTLEDVKILIQQGADVNKTDPAGWTPLSEAVGANNLDIVKYLLTKGADPNSQSREGLMDTNFGGKITPLMEACLNGFCEIARWMLNHKDASKLVSATNLDGWSPADFMDSHIKKARRGDESEAEFRQHLAACKGVLDSIRQLQRKCGFPIRAGDPPEVLPKSDDTPRFAEEKKDASRRARRTEKRKGAAEDYQEAMSSIGSRSRQAEKENKKGKGKEEEDLFDTDDDEPLMRPSSSTSSAARKRVICSDSEDEEEEDTTKKNRGRSSLDAEDANYGLEADERPLQSQRQRAGSQNKRLSGVQLMLQKKQSGGQKRSVEGKKRSLEREDENGIGIVPDDDEIEVIVEPKRRRHESDSSQSEAGATLQQQQQQMDRRDDSFGSTTTRDQWEQQGAGSTAASPVDVRGRSPSLGSLSSASALAKTFVRVIVERPGMEPDEPVLSKAPSDADISQLPNHIPHVKNAIGGASCDWMFEGTAVVSTTIGDLAELCGKKVVEIRCRLKKTLRGELEKAADSADRDSLPALCAALTALESSLSPALALAHGSKYTEKTRDALWRVIDEYASGRMKEDGKWRVESVHIENFNVPACALRTLARMRPRDSLSLRHCEIDDEKLQEMNEELASSSSRNGDVDARLATLDLSYNDVIGSSTLLARTISNAQGVHTVLLQGLTGIEDGRELMKTLRGLPLLTLSLNENPWLDDGCMEELVKGAASDRISSLKTLQLQKCSIKSMSWMEDARSLASLNSISLADSNGIVASGWNRVAGFIGSSTSLKSLDVRGTSVRTVILDALVARSADAQMLTVLCSRCNGLAVAEICRVLAPLVDGQRGAAANLKLQLERDKVEEVRATAPTLAARLLKIAPPNQ